MAVRDERGKAFSDDVVKKPQDFSFDKNDQWKNRLSRIVQGALAASILSNPAVPQKIAEHLRRDVPSLTDRAKDMPRHVERSADTTQQKEDDANPLNALNTLQNQSPVLNSTGAGGKKINAGAAAEGAAMANLRRAKRAKPAQQPIQDQAQFPEQEEGDEENDAEDEASEQEDQEENDAEEPDEENAEDGAEGGEEPEDATESQPESEQPEPEQTPQPEEGAPAPPEGGSLNPTDPQTGLKQYGDQAKLDERQKAEEQQAQQGIDNAPSPQVSPLSPQQQAGQMNPQSQAANSQAGAPSPQEGAYQNDLNKGKKEEKEKKKGGEGKEKSEKTDKKPKDPMGDPWLWGIISDAAFLDPTGLILIIANKLAPHFGFQQIAVAETQEQKMAIYAVFAEWIFIILIAMVLLVIMTVVIASILSVTFAGLQELIDLFPTDFISSLL